MSTLANASSMRSAPGSSRVLRRLFLTLFLRGRSSRGLQRDSVPKSVGQKLAWTLVFYALVGLFTLAFRHQPVFVLSLYLHGMTLVLLGMFVAASAGEVLFNKEEADILLHRPVSPQAVLWAKISVLVQVSLWLAGAFNLTGLWVGVIAQDGGWLFPVVHAVSTALEALFCTGGVVMTYQLCLRWFGRERLEGLMTSVQVLVSIAVVVGGQVLPQLMGRLGSFGTLSTSSWWISLVPPAWFAGFDDALVRRHPGGSWLLAALALIITATVLWLAFGKLARDYETGLQVLAEARPARSGRLGRSWTDLLVQAPPLRWWLREPVSRVAFKLTVAYLVRDRDVKLRIYPSVAPMLVFPLIFLLQDRGKAVESSGFGVAFAGAYLGLIPLLGLNLLRYSQQWQAADLFRSAPLSGPAPLWHGARWAVLIVLTFPMLILFGLIAWATAGDHSKLLLLLPGLIALPLYALIPCVGAKSVPLSMPIEEAKSTGRGLTMVGVMLVAAVISGVAAWAWSDGWLWWFLLAELVLVTGIYTALHASLSSARWQPLE